METFKDKGKDSKWIGKRYYMMKKEWIAAGGICFIIGLLCFLARSLGDTEFYRFLNGSGMFLVGESILVMFIGIAYPEKNKS